MDSPASAQAENFGPPSDTIKGPGLSAAHHFALQDGAVFSNLGLEVFATPVHTPSLACNHRQTQSKGLVCQLRTILHCKMGRFFSNLVLEISYPAAWFWVPGMGMTCARALGVLASPVHTPSLACNHHQTQSKGLVCQLRTILHCKMGRFSQTCSSKSRILPRGFGCLAWE